MVRIEQAIQVFQPFALQEEQIETDQAHNLLCFLYGDVEYQFSHPLPGPLNLNSTEDLATAFALFCPEHPLCANPPDAIDILVLHQMRSALLEALPGIQSPLELPDAFHAAMDVLVAFAHKARCPFHTHTQQDREFIIAVCNNWQHLNAQIQAAMPEEFRPKFEQLKQTLETEYLNGEFHFPAGVGL